VERRYFSIRTGIQGRLKLGRLLDLFAAVFRDFSERCYLQSALGVHCLYSGRKPGTLGTNVPRQIYIKIHKDNIWPILDHYATYTEHDLFDILEFLHDHISKPELGSLHCQQNEPHYLKFDVQAGRVEFREAVNALLTDYSTGYELSPEGLILSLPDLGLADLESEELPPFDPTNVENRVRAAIVRFRRYEASHDDRREAIRALADVLEFMRPQIRVAMPDDEAALFQIANRFGIRHHKKDQQTDYDKAVWYPWIYYYYLASIHATIRLAARRSEPPGPPPAG
jgi:hypothetical protein